MTHSQPYVHSRLKADPKFIATKALRWLNDDLRNKFFRQAISFVNYEKVEGDIVEFGVGVGKSLAMLSIAHEDDKKYFQYDDPVTTKRKVMGFDAFEGLPPFSESHPRWNTGTFGRNYELYHPWLSWNEPLTENCVSDLFNLFDLPPPCLCNGWFDTTIDDSQLRKIALVHIDCDVYESARTVLWAIEPLLQDGCLLLLDDYFCYKADPGKGEARALREFIQYFTHWEVIHYHAYSTFGNSFVLHDKRKQ